MQEPVPRGIAQSSEQPTKELQKNISGYLNQAGFEATPQSVNPEDNSPLKAIEERLGDTAQVIGSTLDEWVEGASESSRVRIAEGKVPIAIAALRGLKRKLMNKAA